MDTDRFPGIKSSSDVFEWLSRFINFERGPSGPPDRGLKAETFRLDRMEALAELAGSPQNCAPSIHIAGSKGKGSVTGMITAILAASGLRIAQYTSPDLGDRRERIKLGNSFFDEGIYVEAGKELVRLAAKRSGEAPTFFELMTLLFFLCARKSRCDMMVIETGMGGRLDATNIVEPLLSVITLIELEHTEYLGSTIAAVAAEKAGIIKKGKPLILAEQSPQALRVFRERAAALEAPLVYFPDAARMEGLRVHRGGTGFTLSFTSPRFFPRPLELSLPIPGEVQARNAGLAVLAAKTALPELDGETVGRGLADFTLPARFERLDLRQAADPAVRGAVVIVDGAHTPKSIELCVRTFTALYGEGGILLFGCAEGKDAAAMAGILCPHFSRIILTAPGNFKASRPEECHELFRNEAGRIGAAGREPPALELIRDTAAAVREALRLGGNTGKPVLGTGSFYLAAEIRKEAGSRV
ncbi:MAG: bifunctional folylpolyglutamate synthase/dihydrofolate synthase [Treponema sp.]|jgi:dihydrofolate synthase/folylpolyglutamate synthase|nr:bifunctional folylpolyglutamate synthase/dihydrofolate synthase [Treponema sp.]